MTNFTKQQQDEICYLIDKWYLQWKNNLVNNKHIHRLRYAKEKLKLLLCGDIDENGTSDKPDYHG